MTLTLGHIRDALEGAIPAVMATCSADGTPNVAFLSQVHYVDETHVALSYQFFNKTRHNILANGQGQLTVVNPHTAQLFRINAPLAVCQRVLPLVTNHLAHLQTITDRAVRRLARRLAPETIEGLVVVITADQFGRPPKPREVSEGLRELEARARSLELQSSAPKPIVMGRHLIELGLAPGKAFGEILDGAFEAQLEGKFFDVSAGLRWLAAERELPLTDEQRRKLAGA